MNKSKVLTKWLLVVLIILALAVLFIFSWNRFGKVKFIPETVKNEPIITVAALEDDTELAIGTIVYPGVEAKNLEVLKNDLLKKVQFDVPDSLEAVVNIYSQDLFNRYSNNQLTTKEIKKTDALNEKAVVLTSSSKKGQLTVTIWQDLKGRTQIVIEKSNNF